MSIQIGIDRYQRLHHDTRLQRQKLPQTLPTALCRVAEHLSGCQLADVVVYYHSDLPQRFAARAISQGCCIHLASGEEALLSHELWHVVQYKRGVIPRVNNMAAFVVLEDERLELEADNMARILDALTAQLASRH